MKEKILPRELSQIKKYQIIYADPAWRYDFSPSKSRQIENHYPTMALEDIKNLDVPAADNCILYLWVTPPKAEEAMQVMKAWGFLYRTQWIWNKEKMGMGRWFRQQHEMIYIGVKGKMKCPTPRSLLIRSVYTENNHGWEHSKKPDYFRDKIMEWYPNLTKLEMFACVQTPGWDIWGNKLPNDVEIGARK